MRRTLTAAIVALGALSLVSTPASAFCGFYVAKADTQLFNKASKVIVARKGGRTVVTMASDFQGDAAEFALVVPVPTAIRKEQIHVTENALVDHVDAYSAPRLVEYHDPNPCNPPLQYRMAAGAMPTAPAPPAQRERRVDALGVKIEAEYTVGEYDIVILSAEQSEGLAAYLTESGYKIPPNATPVLSSYIKQDMKFFVARVNLKEKEKLGFRYLRPIQVAYETHKFMLPIRLGTVNANGPQEMFVFMLTEKGRVETTNYRTQRISSDMDVPIFTKNEFGAFYKAMFDTTVKKDGMRAVYTEYAWNMGWCDPCAADPIPNDKLVELGAFWLADVGVVAPPQPGLRQMRPQNVFITRLHVRYDGAHFPEDLMFQETADSSNFQGRYVLRHPYTGDATCEAGEAYRKSLPQRYAKEAQTLASLTGWDLEAIREKMAKNGQAMTRQRTEVTVPDPWYERMWKKGNNN